MREWPINKHAFVIANEIMHLFEQFGGERYKNGPLTTSEHMIQCAMYALDGNADLELVVGALLHDIGCILPYRCETDNKHTAALNTERVGAAYLRKRGFTNRVCSMIEWLPDAKRYLGTTGKVRLKEACINNEASFSCTDLLMNAEEIKRFEQLPFFRDSIKLAMWDEASKDPAAPLLPLKYFFRLLYEYLNDTYIK